MGNCNPDEPRKAGIMKSETLNLMNHLFDLDKTVAREQRRAVLDILNNNAPIETIPDAVECVERIKGLLKNYASNAKYLRKKEAANYLRVSARTIDHWRESGELPYNRISSRLITLNVSDLDELVRRRRIDCRSA
jgi:excisionase family DNA binding protein